MMQGMDASALLALARSEPRSEVVQDLLGSQECVASSVNVAEVGSKLVDLGLPQAKQLDAVAVTADSAWLDVQQAVGVQVLLIR